MPEPRLRAARVAAGLSQGALATAAGLSRQAVGAIESGRHRPSVDGAIALAAVLGGTVEDLFGSTAAAALPVLGDAPSEGESALAARVGANLVVAPARAALAYGGWPPANAVVCEGRPQPLPGGDLDGFVLVGCDPALALAASMLPAAGPRHVVVLSGSTAAAIEAMAAGRAHAALVHNRADHLPQAPPDTLRVHLARWRVGVAGHRRRPQTVDELCARRTRVVQREDGASSQKAFVAAAAAAGRATPPGPRERGHLEVARRVAGGAPAGITMEPAARSFGLRFTELEAHVAQLWIDARHRDHPAVEGLVAVLRSAAFKQRLALVGSYDTDDCGSQIGGVG